MPYWFDGNNLIGQSAAAAKANPGVRREFLATLGSLHRAGGGRFLVYFDGDEADRAAPPPGVTVRYSAPVSADALILQRLREIRRSGEVIVVTNDRALMTRCRHESAQTVTWQEFMSKMQSRPPARPRKGIQEKPVDVDDWMKYFGFEGEER